MLFLAVLVSGLALRAFAEGKYEVPKVYIYAADDVAISVPEGVALSVLVLMISFNRCFRLR
jgi:hypothetical protein